MTRREKERLSCRYCDGLGEIVRIDGTPEVCPVCKPWDEDDGRDVPEEDHAPSRAPR